MLNVYKILDKTSVEGPGVRFCIWVQGCNRRCKDCWAEETWKFGIGKDYSVEELFEMIKATEGIEGVTFLGGEPFEQSKELSELAKLIKDTGLSVVCFTGYTLEELQIKKDEQVNALLANIDLLIDGAFEYDKFDLSRPWVGSSNQRYLFLTDFYTPETVSQYKNKIEARIAQNGRLEINGMGNFRQIQECLSLQLGKNIVK